MKKSFLLIRISTISAIFIIFYFLINYLFITQPSADWITTTVRRGDIEISVQATGKIDAAERVDLGAQVSGQLKSLKIVLGDSVKKGQLIAEIDDLPQRNELRNAESILRMRTAERNSRLASLKKAESTLSRHKRLLDKRAVSREDYENAETAFTVARADISVLDAQIEQAHIQVEKEKVNLSYTRITAPIDGTVIAIMARQGQTLNAAQNTPTIASVAQLDTMTVKVQISEADIALVKPGQQLYFTVFSNPDKKYPAILNSIQLVPESMSKEGHSSATGSESSGTSNNNNAVYYNALFTIPNPEKTLRIAMTAQVTIVIEVKKNVLLIPASALNSSDSNGDYHIQILNENNRIETRQVKPGLNNHVDVQIIAGLKEGEKIILSEKETHNNDNEGTIF